MLYATPHGNAGIPEVTKRHYSLYFTFIFHSFPFILSHIFHNTKVHMTAVKSIFSSLKKSGCGTEMHFCCWLHTIK